MPPKKIRRRDAPPKAVRQILEQLSEIMNRDDPVVPGARIGDAVGVYAYYDFDGEPIYVGQTSSAFRDRVGRHLTGQRSDAVAKFILDPFEVAEVALYSLPHVATATNPSKPGEPASTAQKKKLLNPYEYSLYVSLRDESRFKAVLNEQPIREEELVELPPAVRARIIPDDMWEDRIHPDTRIARRASTISRLAQSTSERAVSAGMRRTLLLQARRLAWLAERRVAELGIEVPDPDEPAVPAGGDDDE